MLLKPAATELNHPTLLGALDDEEGSKTVHPNCLISFPSITGDLCKLTQAGSMADVEIHRSHCSDSSVMGEKKVSLYLARLLSIAEWTCETSPSNRRDRAD
jgi:hypothetical protein